MSVLAGVAVAAILVGTSYWLSSKRAGTTVGSRDLSSEQARRALVVVTGAGSGIGLELALLFSALGCHLLLVGRTASTLSKAALQCTAAGARSADICVCDVTSLTDTARLRATIASFNSTKGTRLTHLVLNAGRGAIMPFRVPCHQDVDGDVRGVDGTGELDGSFIRVARQTMEVNYFSNVRLLQLLLPEMVSTQSPHSQVARVLVVSSLAGVLPSTLRSAYTASKHAMQGFINALRGEYRAAEITFTLACPGYVETPFHEKAAAVINGGPSASLAGGSSDRPVAVSTHRVGSMSAHACAVRCAKAMLLGQRELVMTTSGRLAYMLRPFLPTMIDTLAAKKSYHSVGMQPPK